MRRNCNLELRLVTSTDSDHHHHHHHHRMNENQQQEEQPSIFFSGRLFGYDAAELQARAILLLASQKMEGGRLRSETGSDPGSPSLTSQQLYSPTGCLSMKRSLQMFLQKRNHRIQATSPYNINDEARACRFWKLG